MSVTARVVMLVFSAIAISFIIATAATKDSVTKTCFVSLDQPMFEFPMPSIGLFRGEVSSTLGSISISGDLKTKDLDEVGTLFEAAQAFAILSAITFFAASCVHVAQFVGIVPQSVERFAGFIHLFGALFAVICGSILLGAVHKNLKDFPLFGDNDHSFSECSLNYGIPFIFVAAGLGIVNCLIFCRSGAAAVRPRTENC